MPKGHAEAGENPDETAKRELAEETGITEVEIDHKAKFEEHYMFLKGDELVNKTVIYFLGRVQAKAVKIQAAEIGAYKWLSFDDAIKLATFDGTKKILSQASSYLTK